MGQPRPLSPHAEFPAAHFGARRSEAGLERYVKDGPAGGFRAMLSWCQAAVRPHQSNSARLRRSADAAAD